MKALFVATLAAALGMAGIGPAAAEYPDKPVHVIFPN